LIPAKTAVRAIIRRGRYVMLVQRIDGRWEFPGGKTDGQEPLSALKREILEETGLVVKDTRHYYTLYNQERGYWTMFYFVAVTGTIRLQPSELRAYKWVSIYNKGLKLVSDSEKVIERLRGSG
jgi:8-oxo-dGTP pyrophosphatase MutT (NUDIX family)